MSRRKCTAKWKIAHATEDEAQRHLGSLYAKGMGRGMTAYRCPAGHWHVGSGAAHGRSGKARRLSR